MTATKAVKPNGGADACLVQERSTPNTTLMQQALTRENLQRAWEQVKANHGAPGIDGMTVEQFPEFIRSPKWASVKKALEDGTYEPQPVRRVYIPKDSGGRRPLGIPPVLDRVIEQALAQVMEPLFDPEFSEFSYWKQWRRCRKRVRELLKLGVSKAWAIPVALSRKSYWHLSRTMATQWGMNDAWLESQGLVSARNIWIAFHYPAANQSGIRVASR